MKRKGTVYRFMLGDSDVAFYFDITIPGKSDKLDAARIARETLVSFTEASIDLGTTPVKIDAVKLTVRPANISIHHIISVKPCI